MIAEIVGVSGTGKSTIAQAIAQHDSAIQANYRVKWRYVLPAYYVRTALAIPTYLVHYRSKGKVLWAALKWMTYLEKLHYALSRLDKNNLILLDQGPVFWFTYLHAFGSDGIQDKWFTRWWTRELESWSSILDFIFYLDCTDAVLIERVRNRSKKHRIQGLSDQEAREFLSRYREGYRHVLARLTHKDGPSVCHLSTERESPGQIADQILNELLA